MEDLRRIASKLASAIDTCPDTAQACIARPKFPSSLAEGVGDGRVSPQGLVGGLFPTVRAVMRCPERQRCQCAVSGLLGGLIVGTAA